MCGLGGEFRFHGDPADVGAIARMTACMEHRGPDGGGLWSQGPVALGHRRLKVIDLSAAGDQPMVDAELGLALVFNGCVYNYRELREELRSDGYHFFSDSDTEVILKAHHRWGSEAPVHFIGMFAYAVSERDTGRLFLVRDRLGIKPLYLDESSARLRFASTLPALLHAGGVDTAIDKVALHSYLTFHSVVPAPRTILAGVRKLPPATVRIVEADGRGTETVYWRPEFTRAPWAQDWTADDWSEEVQRRLRAAVERRSVADVPTGVLLSGGLDSSVIVGMLAQGGQRSLSTFSIGFQDAGGEQGDEFTWSDIVARHFGTDHHQIRISTARLLPALERAVSAMSEPMVSHDAVAFHLLSQEVAEHVTVVQSGQGADEVFAGYDWYPPLAQVPRGQAVDAYSSVFFDRSDAPEWLTGADESRAFVERHFARPGADTSLDAALRLDTTVMLVDDPVKRVDNMTMASGLEARVPFLDHELVEVAARCPPELKLAGGGKGVLKAASRGIVPDEVIDRTKGYFPVPAIRHLSGGYLDLVRHALTDPAAKERGLYRPDAVESMLADPNATRTTLGSNALWQLALMELWLQSMGVS